MASASEQLYDGYPGDTSLIDANPMSFQEFWKMYQGKYVGFGAFKDNPYSLGNKIANIFSGDVSRAEQDYQTYLQGFESDKNDQKAAYSNWKTQQREDTGVQRAVNDYKAAGLNPYLLVSGGSSIAAPSSAMQYSSSKRGSESKDSADTDGKLLSTALKILALIIFKKA